jgi:hypothetical protein
MLAKRRNQMKCPICDEKYLGDGIDPCTDCKAKSVDSSGDTWKHKQKVSNLLSAVIFELHKRSSEHDMSKLEKPEKPFFDRYTKELSNGQYGSVYYQNAVAKIKPATIHHNAHNRHHPEYHNLSGGIIGMTLVDLIEMLCDWMAATERNPGGDIVKSIDISQKKFGFSDELKAILINTVVELKEHKWKSQTE